MKRSSLNAGGIRCWYVDDKRGVGARRDGRWCLLPRTDLCQWAEPTRPHRQERELPIHWLVRWYQADQGQNGRLGATDAPMDGAEVAKEAWCSSRRDGGVVAIYNLDGIASGTLKLDGPVLAEIFMGGITKWNDAKMQP